MPIPLFVVDAFADRAFSGNPAGVCLLPAPREAEWMQALAAEMKHSETAFLSPEEGLFRLRWFTPAAEVDLCGHATLASAHILWETGRLAPGEEARFATRSGRLTARRAGEEIEMDFPAAPAAASPLPEGLARAIGATPRWAGRNRFDYLLELESDEVVRALAPDMEALSRLEVRGVMVTAPARAGASYDFVSRFFAPAVGVPEDPVTGSAHCALAPYWAARLGRAELTGYQASPRGGRVRVHVSGDRVALGGRAVTVVRGELAVG